MTDKADRANEKIQTALARSKANIHEAVQKIPIGKAGTCNWCGYDFDRVVLVSKQEYACGKCRDEFKL